MPLKPARPVDFRSAGRFAPVARPYAYEAMSVGPGPAGTEEGAILSNNNRGRE
jgi:hypothetical protein